MKKFIYSLTLISTVFFKSEFFCQAQSWQWSYSINDTTSDARAKNSVDSKGNIYLMGCYATSSISVGSYTLTNKSYPKMCDSYLIKFDRTGQVLWAKNFGGVENDIINDLYIDAEDRIYIGGQFNSSSFTIGNFTLSVTDSTGYWHDSFAAILDTSGNVLLAFKAGGPGHDQCWAVSGDKTGFIMTGNFGTSPFNIGGINLTNSMSDNSCDFFIAKFTHSGNLLWIKQGGSSENDWIEDCTSDAFGNVYLSVDFRTQANTGATTFNTAGGWDNLLLKYDAQGKLLWEKHLGGDDRDYVSQLKLTNNELYFAGQTNSHSLAIGPFTTTNNKSYAYTMFFGKMDLSGNVVWIKNANEKGSSYFGAHPVGIATDLNNNVYLAANYSGDSLVMDGGTAINYENGLGLHQVDFILTKYTSSGNQIWLKSFGGVSYDWAYGLSTDNNGSIFLSGYHSKVMALENLILTNTYGGQIPFLAKYGSPNYTGFNENISGSLCIHPNPTQSVTHILMPWMGEKTVSLFDINGKLIEMYKTSENSSQLSCSGLCRGVYLLRLKSEKHAETVKLVVE